MDKTTVLSFLFKVRDETEAALARVRGNLDKVDEKVDKTTSRWKGLGTALGGIMGAGGTAALGFLSDAANAAAADEANVIKLQKAVENSGAAWEANSDRINARIKAGQNLAFTDDQIRDSLSALVASTGSLDEALARQSVAMDLARGTGMSLETASKLLGKVTDENTGVLKRYGVTVRDGATATELMAEVQKRFGGQAEAYGNTTAASIFKVKDQISEWRESIGAALGPAQGFIALLPGMSTGMTMAGGAAGTLTSMLGITRTGMLLTIPIAGGLTLSLGPLLLIVGGIALAIGLLALAWSNNWGDIQGKTQAALGFLGAAFDGFKVMLAVWGLGIIGVVRGAIGITVGILNTLIDGWNAVALRLGLPILGKIEVTTPGLDDAEAELNNVARSRSTTIYVNTINSIEERRLGGTGMAGSYASGTSYVPRTGLYELHRGEAVIPAEHNRPGLGGGAPTVQVFIDGRRVDDHTMARVEMLGV